MISLLKLAEYWRETAERINNQHPATTTTMFVYCTYVNSISQTDLTRWKQYGTPQEPLPFQDLVNSTLGKITRHSNVDQVYFISTPKKKQRGKHINKKQIALPQEITGKTAKRLTLELLPVFWATQQEVKDKLKTEQDKQEVKVLKKLATRPSNASISGKIPKFLNLDKAKIRMLLRTLARSRPLQVTLCNLIAAGRFKTIHNNQLMRTQCPRCKEPDSWGHHMECFRDQLAGLKTKNDIEWKRNMLLYIKSIHTEHPAKYTASDKKY